MRMGKYIWDSLQQRSSFSRGKRVYERSGLEAKLSLYIPGIKKIPLSNLLSLFSLPYVLSTSIHPSIHLSNSLTLLSSSWQVCQADMLGWDKDRKERKQFANVMVSRHQFILVCSHYHL